MKKFIIYHIACLAIIFFYMWLSSVCSEEFVYVFKFISFCGIIGLLAPYIIAGYRTYKDLKK